jgi:hypothetical protein
VVDHFKEELKEGDREAALDSLVRCKNQVSFHDTSYPAASIFIFNHLPAFINIYYLG